MGMTEDRDQRTVPTNPSSLKRGVLSAQLITTGNTHSCACRSAPASWNRHVFTFHPLASLDASVSRGMWRVWVSDCPEPLGKLRMAGLAPRSN